MFKKSLRHSHLQSWIKSIELHWLFFESTLIYTGWRFFRAAGIHGALDQVHKPCNSEMIQLTLACASLWIVLGPSASTSWWQSSREGERMAGFYRHMVKKYLQVFQILNQLFVCSCCVLQKSLVVRPLSLSMKWAEKSHCLQWVWALASD